MKIWQVWDGDYDGDWVVATYESEALALDHAETYGLSRVESCDVLSSLTDEAADPELRAKRSAERAESAEKARQQYAARIDREQRSYERAQSITIQEFRNPGLCSCRVFSSSDEYFVTENRYCRYCGKWAPEVFRANQGETALEAAISELDLHYRTKMRQLCGLLPPAADAVGLSVEDSTDSPRA